MTPLWKWLLANLQSNILPVLSSSCSERGGEQSSAGLLGDHLKWLATPQNIRILGSNAPGIHFLLVFILFFCLFVCLFVFPTSHICVLFGFSSTKFTKFQWNTISGLLSEFWGWSVLLGFIVLLFSVWSDCLNFYWQDHVFDLLERGATWGVFCTGKDVSSFFFSKLHFPPVYYFNFNFSITKIFSLAKENVFYVICYVR